MLPELTVPTIKVVIPVKPTDIPKDLPLPNQVHPVTPCSTFNWPVPTSPSPFSWPASPPGRPSGYSRPPTRARSL